MAKFPTGTTVQVSTKVALMPRFIKFGRNTKNRTRCYKMSIVPIGGEHFHKICVESCALVTGGSELSYVGGISWLGKSFRSVVHRTHRQ